MTTGDQFSLVRLDFGPSCPAPISITGPHLACRDIVIIHSFTTSIIKSLFCVTSCQIRQLLDNFLLIYFIMSDFFKSALGYISGGGVAKDENDFVGQIVELGNQKLRVKRVIAQGN